MAKIVTWSVAVKVFFVESTKKFRKNGKPVSMRVESRKMFLLDPNALFDSGDYRIVLRKGLYTISVIPRKAQPYWSNPSRKAETWYIKAADTHYDDGSVERPFKRTDDKPMDSAAILRWLAARMGQAQAEQALFALQTAEPEAALSEAA
jgi:hypothetical protein